MFAAVKQKISKTNMTAWMLEYVAIQTFKELDERILVKRIKHNIEEAFQVKLQHETIERPFWLTEDSIRDWLEPKNTRKKQLRVTQLINNTDTLKTLFDLVQEGKGGQEHRANTEFNRESFIESKSSEFGYESHQQEDSLASLNFDDLRLSSSSSSN